MTSPETLATLYTVPPEIIYRSDRDAEGRLDSSTPIEFVLTNLSASLRKSITQHAKTLRNEGQDEDESISEACRRHIWVEIVYFDGETPERFVRSAIPSTSPFPPPEADMALDGVGVRVYLKRTSLMISSAHAKRPFRVAFVVTLDDKCTTLLSKPFRVLEKRAKNSTTESKGQNLEPPVPCEHTRNTVLRRIRLAYAMLKQVAITSHNANPDAILATTPTGGRKRGAAASGGAVDPSLMAAGHTLYENLALNMPAGELDESHSMIGSLLSHSSTSGNTAGTPGVPNGNKRARVGGEVTDPNKLGDLASAADVVARSMASQSAGLPAGFNGAPGLQMFSSFSSGPGAPLPPFMSNGSISHPNAFPGAGSDPRDLRLEDGSGGQELSGPLMPHMGATSMGFFGGSGSAPRDGGPPSHIGQANFNWGAVPSADAAIATSMPMASVAGGVDTAAAARRGGAAPRQSAPMHSHLPGLPTMDTRRHGMTPGPQGAYAMGGVPGRRPSRGPAGIS